MQLRTLVGWNSRMEPKLGADWREGAVSVGGVALTELAGTHVVQHGVRFHLVVTWRADGGVTCGRKTGGVVRRSVRGSNSNNAGSESQPRLYIGAISVAAHLGRVSNRKAVTSERSPRCFTVLFYDLSRDAIWRLVSVARSVR